jgi:hypothetical protein
MATYTESFTATDGTLVSSLSGWTKYSGSASPQITNNRCSPPENNPPNTSNIAIAYYNTAVSAAQFSRITISAFTLTGDGAIGVAIRVQSNADSAFYANYYDGTVYCAELINGEATDWTGVSGFAVGDTIELASDATTSTTIYLKKNGTVVETYTGKNALSGGYVGVSSWRYNTETQGDSWEGGDVSAGATLIPRTTLLGAG